MKSDQGKSSYHIYFRDRESHDHERFVTFEDLLTVRENLAKVLPRMVERGMLPFSATAETVVVEQNGIRLNPYQTFSQQTGGVDLGAPFTIRDISSQIKLTLTTEVDSNNKKYLPWRRRGTMPLAFNANAWPGQPPLHLFQGAFTELSTRFRYYGRRIKNAGRFRLRHGLRTLDATQPLMHQGIESDTTIRAEPVVRLEWPPVFFYGIRGPYTGYAAVVLLIVIAIVFYAAFRGRTIDKYYVKLQADFPCKVLLEGDVTELNAPARWVLGSGAYDFRIFPKERPIIDYPVTLYSHVIHRRVKTSDSTVVLSLKSSEVFPETTTTELRVVGYRGEREGRHLDTELLLNQFSYAPDQLGKHVFVLPVGTYSIRLGLDADRLIRVEVGGAVKVVGDHTFHVGITPESGFNYIKFFYKP